MNFLISGRQEPSISTSYLNRHSDEVCFNDHRWFSSWGREGPFYHTIHIFDSPSRTKLVYTEEKVPHLRTCPFDEDYTLFQSGIADLRRNQIIRHYLKQCSRTDGQCSVDLVVEEAVALTIMRLILIFWVRLDVARCTDTNL